MTPEEQVETWKTAVENGYFHKHRHYKGRQSWLAEELKVVNGDALEIGCGSGRVASRVLPQCQSLDACDISQEEFDSPMLRGVWTKVCDGTGNLPYQDEEFDWVYSMNVFHHLHIDQVYRYIEETKRVLRPSGSFIHYMGLDGIGEIGLSPCPIDGIIETKNSFSKDDVISHVGGKAIRGTLSGYKVWWLTYTLQQ